MNETTKLREADTASLILLITSKELALDRLREELALLRAELRKRTLHSFRPQKPPHPPRK